MFVGYAYIPTGSKSARSLYDLFLMMLSLAAAATFSMPTVSALYQLIPFHKTEQDE